MAENDEGQTLTADEEFQAVLQEGDEGKEAEPEGNSGQPEKVKVGDKEYDPAELSALLAEAERAKEIERGGREKFEEARRLREGLEEDRQRVADMQLLLDTWNKGPDGKREVLGYIQQVVGDDYDPDDYTDGEKALHGEIRRLQSALQQQQAKIDALAPVLEDIKTWTGSKKEAELIDSQIRDIKAKSGIDVTRETIQIWKEKGITDPVNALDVILPMLKTASNGKPARQDEVPDRTQENTFDPDDPNMSADDIFKAIRRGEVPSR